jgi:glycerol kinase
MKFVLALDQGTTSSRAIVFDHAGKIRALAQREFRQIFPQPGWVEHDPNEIWSSQIAVAHEVLAKAQLSALDIAAIGIANQRETAIVWEKKTGTPIANAIVWQDRRTASACASLAQQAIAPWIQATTGLVIDAYFSATKIAWLLDHIPGARQKAQAGELAFGTVDTWLAWKLSNGRLHVTDATNASRTLLYDIGKGEWNTELLRIFQVPREMLPDIRPSSELYGETAREIFSHPIPIAAMAGDQHAALFGQLCLRPGMAKNTYGTGCFMLLHTGERPIASANKLLSTVAWQRGGKRDFALEGSVFVAGAAVQWLRDGLGIIKSAAEVEALAASVPDTGGVYLVPAFTGLGAPHWNAQARGTVTGITRGTTAAHLARAALEGICHQVADVLEAMQADAGAKLTELRVDGGAAANNLLMQLQADLLAVPVIRPRVTETTALGTAYLAGLACGYWRDLSDLENQWQTERVFRPALQRSDVEKSREGWHKALSRAKT